ncbi:MAG: hypothetical protein IH850_05705 [Acidobacteria bacterium]|nr:hypothetical protein [Acidobacteriota bacterium]
MVDLLAEAHDLPPETVFPPDWDLFYAEYSKLMTSFLPISGRPMGFTNMSVGHQKNAR